MSISNSSSGAGEAAAPAAPAAAAATHAPAAAAEMVSPSPEASPSDAEQPAAKRQKCESSVAAAASAAGGAIAAASAASAASVSVGASPTPARAKHVGRAKPLPGKAPKAPRPSPSPSSSASGGDGDREDGGGGGDNDPDLPEDASAPLNAASRFAEACERQALAWMERKEIPGPYVDELDDTNTTKAPPPLAADAADAASSPLISVCLPLHNALPFLGATLVSLCHATHRPLEVCAFDDCSSDGSAEVLEQFRPLLEARGVALKLRRSEKTQAAGAGYARNQALAQAAGEYFAMQDADDLSMPARFSLQLRRCREVEAAERARRAQEQQQQSGGAVHENGSAAAAASSSSSSAPSAFPIVLVGCNLQRLPFGATPRWRRWINSLVDAALPLQSFREVPLPCPTWFLSRAAWQAAGGSMPEQLAEDMIFFYENILARGGRLTKVGGGDTEEKEETGAAAGSTAEAGAAASAAANVAATVVPVNSAASSDLAVCAAPPLLIYRNHASNLSGRTPFAMLLGLRVAALSLLVLRGSPRHWGAFADPSAPLCIWNAGKMGKRVYRLLPPDLRQRVQCMADIDPRKLALGHFEAHEAGSRASGRRIPIVSWEKAPAPCLIAVRQELEDNEQQREFLHRIRVVKGWKEGVDYLFLS